MVGLQKIVGLVRGGLKSPRTSGVGRTLRYARAPRPPAAWPHCPIFRYVTELPPAMPATIAPWSGWVFLGIGRSTPMLEEMVAWQPPSGGSRPVPIGSRSVGVSLQPAIPRQIAPQQSPLPLHRSPTIIAQSRSSEAIKCAAQVHHGDAVQLTLLVPVANGSVISTLRAG